MKVPLTPACWGPNVYPSAPDGGWGWAIALAFFLVEICTYGSIKSMGVFLQDLMDEFGESNSRVSWVISISVFTFTFLAPLSTLLSNRYGYRPVVVVGGFLISLGTITSAFTSSINEMYITYGIISGLGYCFSFLPTVTLLAQYFSRRRALVTSVASSGESFAIIAFAPAFTALKDVLGWRFCLVILGVIQSLVMVCGLLLRPIVLQPEPVKDQDLTSEQLSLKQLEDVYQLENEQTRTSISSGVSQGSDDSGVISLSASNADLRNAGAQVQLDCAIQDKEQEVALSSPVQETGPPQTRQSKLLDFSVLTDGAFICYSLFGLFATLGFFAPQLYVIELSKTRGVEPHHASYMLSVMAVAEVVGRLSIGVILNKACCRKISVLLVCVVLMSAVLLTFTLVTEFWGLVVCCALYGYFMGTVGSTHIPMLAEEDVVGIQKMASSAGVYVFIQSFAGLAGPPLGGLLVDLTDNYGAAFYSCAAGMGLSAVFLALVGPAKSGWCRPPEQSRSQTDRADDQAEFLEVDFCPEGSPAKPKLHQDQPL
ncbi:solute carrier family 16 member 6b [Synchiropus splendidus]|uniref:solute carrier family 16 member 6b n=1 Tax=Synchiropus splendidus TaxID=270530 RepID=UPI00237E37BC|nr:solute carrier family 16 member 6b [Synchiropus splendidus]XP_053707215.1 solute carrier family 16 member 6b [Synchiropus splendidus]